MQDGRALAGIDALAAPLFEDDDAAALAARVALGDAAVAALLAEDDDDAAAVAALVAEEDDDADHDDDDRGHNDGRARLSACALHALLAKLLARGHGHAVDLWALGVVLYELLTGRTPFADSDQSKIFMKIVHSQRCLAFPDGVSRKAVNLVRRLLKPKPTLRVGMTREGYRDLRNHRWFTGINWTTIQKRCYISSFVPSVSNELDMHNLELPSDAPASSKAEVASFDGDNEPFAKF